MAKTVFILGAGASVEAGGLLMANFLDRAWSLLATARENDATVLQTVFEGVRDLQLVHSKSRLDLRNLERVFAAFEMGALFGRMPGTKNPEALVGAMKRLIVYTLEQSIQFPYSSRSSPLESPSRRVGVAESYSNFAQLISRARDRGDSVAIVTFNYDVALDHALEMYNVPISYGLRSMGELTKRLPLLKLHGSLNWVHCHQCKDMVTWSVVDYVGQQSATWVPNEHGKLPLCIGTDMRMFQHGHSPHQCPEPVEPFIVPPTWNKGGRYEALRLVWSRAAEELAEAENLFIIGYSWPRTDEFFHHLYAIGTAGRALLRHFLLVDTNERTAARYRRQLLGEQARQRFRHAKHASGKPLTFRQAVPDIQRLLKL